MKLLKRKFSIKPHQTGLLFRENQFVRKLEAGIHRFFDFQRKLEVVCLPTNAQWVTVTNQEVLTKDKVALRFSYFLEYRIADIKQFANKFDLFNQRFGNLYEAQQLIHSLSKVYLREKFAAIESEALNERRNELFNVVPESLSERLKEYGLTLDTIMVIDITFPKRIQDLFAKQLEAKIRAKADLENARTTVATARALKNAAEMMKANENVKFIQVLETLGKIAEKGRHTFHFGDITHQLLNAKS